MLRLIAGPLALAAVALLAGAPAAAPVPKHLFPETPLYFSTQVGAEWEYDDNGREYIFRVMSVENEGGASLVKIGTRWPGEETTYESYVMEVGKAGVREVSSSSRRLDPPLPIVKWPCKKGDEWSAPLSIDGEKRADCSFRCEGVEEVKVPAGAFRALKIVQVSAGSDGKTVQTITTWYAPSIGPVRTQYAPNAVRELVKFTPGKAAPKKK